MDKIEKKFSCIILAGGAGKRLGGKDKGLVIYKNQMLIQYVLDAIKPEADEILISANRNIDEYKTFGYEVITDTTSEHQGPLGGIASSLPCCKNDWALIVPCDMPFLPHDIIEKLSSNISNRSLCIAEANDRLQLVLLIKKNLLPSILQSLENNQLRILQWAESQNPAICHFGDNQLFKNINNVKDLL